MTKDNNLLNLQKTPIGSTDVLNPYQSSSANTVPILLVQCEQHSEKDPNFFQSYNTANAKYFHQDIGYNI
jgi:hypothetical protein